ncbi:MAG: response regulator [Fimbriimonadaceae bacterium]|nr:response regulator [Fimbriimonadaceae bacterium]
MRPTVLIVDDSPSTAHLARLALSALTFQVEVAPTAPRALELVTGSLAPAVVVIDAHLPGVQPGAFLVQLRDHAPRAAVVLLVDRGIATPLLPPVQAQLAKPLQPRRLRTVVQDLLDRGLGDWA